MVIYADVLIALNIFVNYLILLCASRLSGAKTNRLRIVLASVFGGVCSLVILLPAMNALINVAIKTAVTLLITAVAFSFGGIRSFLKALLSLLAVNVAFAGVSLAVYYFIPPKNMLYQNGTVYFETDIKFFIIAAVASYLFIKLAVYLLKRYASAERLCRITVSINGKNAVLCALVDTGNSLCDSFTNKAVTVVEYSAVARLLPPDILKDTYNGELMRRCSVAPYKTACGTGLLKTVRFDRMIIEGDGGRWEIASPVLALTSENLSDGQFQALLNERIFQQEEKKNNEKAVGKAE
jgi:stage II sporulation protein GA (sporulation sigma-E factor processing peptidase)